MSKESPTSRTLAAMRKLGAVVAITEKWNPHAKLRQDLFGFIDILALLGPNTIGIQATTGTNHAARKAKIIAEPKALAWLKAGNLIEIHSWTKAGPRGKVKVWTCRREEIVLEDFV